jgi:hypothetical protein
MAGKLLIGAGIIFMLLGGGVYVTELNALQMVHASFETSVQHYAGESAAIGMVVAQILASIGLLFAITGVVVWAIRNRQRAQSATLQS